MPTNEQNQNQNGVGFTSLAGLLVVVISALILAFNIGLPNDMLGFLFFAQVTLY